jgi:hypothetical protein
VGAYLREPVCTWFVWTARPPADRGANLHFSAEIPCFRGFSLLIDFFGSPGSGPNWQKNGGIQAVSGKFPVKLTGNFFARNREFSFEEQGIFCTEQGIQFRGTGNSKRCLRYERSDHAHRLQQQREN